MKFFVTNIYNHEFFWIYSIVVGNTLIWRKAVAAIHIIAIILYQRYLNLADGQKIAKLPN